MNAPVHDPLAQGFEPNDRRTHTFIAHVAGWDLYWYEDRSMVYVVRAADFNKVYLNRFGGSTLDWGYDSPIPGDEVATFLRGYVALHR